MWKDIPKVRLKIHLIAKMPDVSFCNEPDHPDMPHSKCYILAHNGFIDKGCSVVYFIVFASATVIHIGVINTK